MSLPDGPKPIKSNDHPISCYYAQLTGGEKSILLRSELNPIDQHALDFNWFLRRMVPLKKNYVEETFDDIFSQVRQNQYPSWVRRTFA